MLDAENAGCDYIEDIYKFYRLVETNNWVHDYMNSQVHINKKKWSNLVDWLIDVHCGFELMPETLYLAIHIVDRYLLMETVLRTELQLLGVTAMFIAHKYEEDWFLVEDFILITNKGYNRENILSMEKSILDKLDWNLSFPTQYVFLVWFLKAAAALDKEMENMVFFFAELGLMEYSMIMYYPSMVAASAIYAAHCTLKKSPAWSKRLEHHTGFSETQLMDCVKMLVKFHSLVGEGKLKMAYRKYFVPSTKGCCFASSCRKAPLRGIEGGPLH